jgi:hypothetical protein
MIVYFTHQSQSLNADDWFTLATLCLAPLIAHIIAGVPSPTYLKISFRAFTKELGYIIQPPSYGVTLLSSIGEFVLKIGRPWISQPRMQFSGRGTAGMDPN